MEKSIITLSVGEPKEFDWKGKTMLSGIGKAEISVVNLTKGGFIGDRVANPAFHGGPDRAVCLYPFEHYAYWNEKFALRMSPPAFGENICAVNMLEKDVYIGDIYEIGDCVIQITQGRIPCSTISKFNGEANLLAGLIKTGYTGYFFRVLEEGTVHADHKLKLLERRQSHTTVLEANLIMFSSRKDKASVEKLLKIAELAQSWKEKFEKFLEK